MIHADVLGERARLTPRAAALIDAASGRRWTYEELDLRATRLARGLAQDCGLRPGDRVGILAHNRVEFVDAYCAAARGGFVLVPMCTRHTAGELAHVVRHSRMRVLLYDDALADLAAPTTSPRSSRRCTTPPVRACS